MNEKDNSKLTVLVCDDEKDIANAISIFLRSEGYNVLTASNGKEALELVEEEDDQQEDHGGDHIAVGEDAEYFS